MANRKRKFPIQGQGIEDLYSEILNTKNKDASWQTGKMFGFVYHPGDKIAEFVKKVHDLYFFENALNPSLFPSIRRMENEIVAMVADLLHADDNFAGNITSGGTESIFLALKVARDMAREKKPHIKQPEIIIPITTHPAFNKAAHYLGIKVLTVPVGADKKADLDSIQEAITSNTIMLVGSAPNFPHGVVDPIPEIGQIAIKNDICFHVDACLGGFMLPFMEMAGYNVPPFDFRVPGVSSISADAHKYGYAPKGTSIILYKNSEYRKHQIYLSTEWPGGIFATAGFSGTRSGAVIAATWALFHVMGTEKYINMSRETIELSKYFMRKINEIPGLEVIANPDMSVFSFTSDKKDIYLIGDEMTKRGWYLDRLQFPESLHMTLTHSNIKASEGFIKDLTISVNTIRNSTLKKVSSSALLSMTKGIVKALPEKLFQKAIKPGISKLNKNNGRSSGSAAMYGLSASLDNRKNVKMMVLELFDSMYSLH